MLATLTSLAALLWKAGVLQHLITALGAGLVGWLFPSPIQKAANAQADVKKAEDAASDAKTGNRVDDLDKLP